jgi:hypothetical protein
MGHVGEQITAILTAIIGVAILSVILSKRSNTASVIGSAANAFSMALGTAVSPITGNNSLGPVGGFTGFGGGIIDSPGSLNF